MSTKVDGPVSHPEFSFLAEDFNVILNQGEIRLKNTALFFSLFAADIATFTYWKLISF